MDDVDAVQAQIARNMLVSGDWVTARLDDDLSMHGSSRLECPSAQVFNRWLSKKLSGHPGSLMFAGRSL